MESMSWVRAVSTLSNWVCMISFMISDSLSSVLLARARDVRFMQLDRG